MSQYSIMSYSTVLYHNTKIQYHVIHYRTAPHHTATKGPQYRAIPGPGPVAVLSRSDGLPACPGSAGQMGCLPARRGQQHDPGAHAVLAEGALEGADEQSKMP